MNVLMRMALIFATFLWPYTNYMYCTCPHTRHLVSPDRGVMAFLTRSDAAGNLTH